MRLKIRAVSLAIGALVALPTFATPVTGIASITGGVTVTSTAVNFDPTFGPNGANTGSFSGLTGGTIQSLTGGPVTGPISVPDFIVFNVGGLSPVHFNLTDILPGYGTLAACASNAVGSTCTPAGSPFTLTQIAPGRVGITLSVDGIAYTGSSASGTSATIGAFTTQDVAAGTITSILAMLQGGGSVFESYSATFVPTAAAVPEPASLLLIGIGLAGAGIFARKKIRR